jgi:hypothetical protein
VELTREIYLNIGSGVSTLIPMYLVLMLAVVMMAHGLRQRINVYRQGKTLKRMDDFPRRMAGCEETLISQDITEVLSACLADHH